MKHLVHVQCMFQVLYGKGKIYMESLIHNIIMLASCHGCISSVMVALVVSCSVMVASV